MTCKKLPNLKLIIQLSSNYKIVFQSTLQNLNSVVYFPKGVGSRKNNFAFFLHVEISLMSKERL